MLAKGDLVKVRGCGPWCAEFHKPIVWNILNGTGVVTWIEYSFECVGFTGYPPPGTKFSFIKACVDIQNSQRDAFHADDKFGEPNELWFSEIHLEKL